MGSISLAVPRFLPHDGVVNATYLTEAVGANCTEELATEAPIW